MCELAIKRQNIYYPTVFFLHQKKSQNSSTHTSHHHSCSPVCPISAGVSAQPPPSFTTTPIVATLCFYRHLVDLYRRHTHTHTQTHKHPTYPSKKKTPLKTTQKGATHLLLLPQPHLVLCLSLTLLFHSLSLRSRPDIPPSTLCSRILFPLLVVVSSVH